MNKILKPAVIIFSTAYLPFIGGAELAIKEITDRIPDYDFYLITARMKKKLPKRERIGNIEVFRVGFGYSFLDKLLSPFWGAMLARQLIKKYNVRVFWSVMVTFASGASFLLKLLQLNKNIPILLTLQEGDSERHLKFSNLGLTGLSWFFAVRMTDRIQAISNYLKDFVARMGAKCEIDVVPNGADVSKIQIPNYKLSFDPSTGFRVAPRNSRGDKLRIPSRIEGQTNLKFQNSNSKIIITTSRLVHKNGIDILIKAVAEVVKEIPGVKLWVLGGGEEERNLRNLTAKLNIGENVEFFGEIENEKIYEYLAKADVFVRPSRSEGLGTSFLEAMAAGLPIIGTPVGGVPDFLEDGETGLFCKVDDPKDLAQKILKLFGGGSLLENIARQGRDLVRRSYSWDSIALRMKDIFDKMTL